MPIRINLLAEAQAAEELRRRDPVKRSIWGAGILVAVVLFGWTLLFTKTITENSQLSGLANKLSTRTNQYNKILTEKSRLMEVKSKLAALNRFTTNRLLTANLLDALPQSLVDGIQLTSLSVDQKYLVVPEVPATKTESGKVIPGRPATATERTRIILGAMDSSSNPGPTTINLFKETLAKNTYLLANGVSANNILLEELGQTMYQPETGSQGVSFKLEVSYPDKAH
jgi:hypothetical protein